MTGSHRHYMRRITLYKLNFMDPFYFFVVSSQLRWGRCGLGGQVRVNVSLPGVGKRRTCQGTLTDWNMRSCSSTSKLLLRATRCRFMDNRGILMIFQRKCNKLVRQN